MNLRRFIVDGDLQLALTELPDFENAKVESWIDKNRDSGPQKSTREALERHRNTIRLMIQKKVSTRQISAFLKEEYGIRISHSTISRNTKFIFKD
jgi:IS30 family transposase